jgi:hypothetical protein
MIVFIFHDAYFGIYCKLGSCASLTFNNWVTPVSLYTIYYYYYVHCSKHIHVVKFYLDYV